MNPLAGRSIWAYSWKLQAEQDAAAILATCRQFGVTTLVQEVAYGLVWQGAIDGLSPRSLMAVESLRMQLAAGGVSLVPCVVPRGLINQGEAEFHAQIARICGAIVVDLEVDASGDYWPTSEIDLVSAYARALREAAGPGVILGWQPDGRISDPGREGEWNAIVVNPLGAGLIDVFLPQLYAGAISPWNYGGGMLTVARDAVRFSKFAALGVAMCPTVYIADSMDEPATLWRMVKDRSIGVCGFRLGAADRSRLEAFQALEVTAPEPKPEPSPIYTLDAVKLALVQKTLNEEWAALAHDAGQLAGAK